MIFLLFPFIVLFHIFFQTEHSVSKIDYNELSNLTCSSAFTIRHRKLKSFTVISLHLEKKKKRKKKLTDNFDCSICLVSSVSSAHLLRFLLAINFWLCCR